VVVSRGKIMWWSHMVKPLGSHEVESCGSVTLVESRGRVTW
jgi:hypothetical protein